MNDEISHNKPKEAIISDKEVESKQFWHGLKGVVWPALLLYGFYKACMHFFA
jgi:hypothetical protein